MPRFSFVRSLSPVGSLGTTTPAVRVVIPFTPLLVNEHRKVPVSAFGRVRDDTVFYNSSPSVASSAATTPAVRVLIPFTPLLVSQYRKVPLSAFGRVRDDTVLYFQLQLARGRVRDDTVVRHLMIWAESGYAHST